MGRENNSQETCHAFFADNDAPVRDAADPKLSERLCRLTSL
jgi:hypothetical protein